LSNGQRHRNGYATRNPARDKFRPKPTNQPRWEAKTMANYSAKKKATRKIARIIQGISVNIEQEATAKKTRYGMISYSMDQIRDQLELLDEILKLKDGDKNGKMQKMRQTDNLAKDQSGQGDAGGPSDTGAETEEMGGQKDADI